MQRRVKRVVEDVKAAVVHEVETLVCHGLPSQTSGGAWSDLMQVLPSADLLLDELEVGMTRHSAWCQLVAVFLLNHDAGTQLSRHRSKALSLHAFPA